jgi:hypothetical protein
VKKYFCRLVVASAISTSSLFAASLTVGTNTGGNAFPFGQPVGGVGTRYQEAYSSTLFSGPIAITGIDFFLSSAGTLWGGTYTLSLSTISADVNTLSDSNFDSNRGANNTLFTSVALSGAAPSTLSFTGGPFSYNPAQGNLLLDIQITNLANVPGTAAFQDGDGAGPATIARYHNFGIATTGFGLVTRFDFAAVNTPEPGTFVLLGAGLLAIAGRRFRRA